MSTVLVTGANGFVGSHMVPALLDAGHRVIALVRDDDGAALVLRRLGPARQSLGRDPPRRRHEARHAARGRSPAPTPSCTSSPIAARLGRRRDAAPRQHRGHAQHPRGGDGRRRPPVRPPRRARRRRRAGPPLRELQGQGDGARARERPRAGRSWRRRCCSVRATGSSTSSRASSGCRPASSRSRARATRASSRWRSRPGAGRGPGARRRRDDRPRVPARRAALLDLPRDRGGGPARHGRQAALLVPMPVAADPPRRARGRRRSALPFPVATDQLRQLRLDNIGPLDAVRSRLRLRSPARWRAG